MIAQLRRPLAELPDPLPVPQLVRPNERLPRSVSVRPPGSKSITNRALLLAALASGRSTVRFPLLGADDAERMLAAITRLGVAVDRAHPDALVIDGVGGRWRPRDDGGPVVVNLNNAGTATRFLAAASLVSPGPVTIDGNERMRQRPIGELADALEQIGCAIAYTGTPGCPPITITPPPGHRPGASLLEFGQTQSSQFISALLLTAPFVPGGLTIKMKGPITSKSYIRMTLRLLADVGAVVRSTGELEVIRVEPGSIAGPGVVLPGFSYAVEPDASSATYWWAAGAMVPSLELRVRGLDATTSVQGDAAFPGLLIRMGASVRREEADVSPEHEGAVACRGPDRLTPIMADMADMPDATMTLAACCAVAGGLSVLRGVTTLRVKETDRITATRVELAKVGAKVTENVNGDGDVMSIEAPIGGIDCAASAPPVVFDTYHDHRMAMSMALIGLRRPNVWIANPRCVDKTYPTFFADLARLYP